MTSSGLPSLMLFECITEWLFITNATKIASCVREPAHVQRVN